ncbi:MAG: 50S ribosomal protein L13 [Sedimentisphaerales bacterium]|nr:50S ribosomal protein L13 [Sedimentisphaerales bacterium]MBN2843471.1 50S ribosomal protein L13 [Sedimentisphaerales bacterium]
MQAQIQKTTLANKETLSRDWFIVDASDKVLGRLAAKIAMTLMGKDKAIYTPFVDTGDFVIVTNAEKIATSGRKAEYKMYDYYTNHAGGHKYVTFEDAMAKKPEWVIEEAVRRMLPKNKIGRHMLAKLKVYRGSEHPHAAQTPRVMEL